MQNPTPCCPCTHVPSRTIVRCTKKHEVCSSILPRFLAELQALTCSTWVLALLSLYNSFIVDRGARFRLGWLGSRQGLSIHSEPDDPCPVAFSVLQALRKIFQNAALLHNHGRCAHHDAKHSRDGGFYRLWLPFCSLMACCKDSRRCQATQIANIDSS